MNRGMRIALLVRLVLVALVIAGSVAATEGVVQAAVRIDSLGSPKTAGTSTPTSTPTSSSASPSISPSPSPSPSPSATKTASPTPAPTHASPHPTPSKTTAAPTQSATASPTPTATSTTATPSATASATPTPSATVDPYPVSNDPAHPTRKSQGWIYLLFGGIGAVAVVAGAWFVGMRRNRSQ